MDGRREDVWFLRRRSLKRLALVLLTVAALWAVFRAISYAATFTRGVRNNNPGNLKWGLNWPGLVGIDDKGFCRFRTMYDGLAAMALNLVTYPRRFGIHTLRDMGDVWAPPNDNKGASYGEQIGRILGVSPDLPYPFTNREAVIVLVRAMARQENTPAMLAMVSEAQTAIAVDAALSNPQLPGRAA